MAGTSVIANAPFIVCIARSSASLAAIGRACACESHASMVTRCPPTSVPRISSSTGSTLAAIVASSSTTGASAATSTHRLDRRFGDRRGDFDDGRSRRDVRDVFARGDAFGDGFDAREVGGQRRFAAQRGVQLRQRVEGLVDERDDRVGSADACRRARG